MGIQRTTQDSARIAGALTGAGLVAALGMGPAYMVVVHLLRDQHPADAEGRQRARHAAAGRGRRPRPASLAVARPQGRHRLRLAHAASARGDAARLPAQPDGVSAVQRTCCRSWRRRSTTSDQTTLGYMVAGAASGALTGSIVLSRFAHRVPPARMMIIFSWPGTRCSSVFAHTPDPAIGHTRARAHRLRAKPGPGSGDGDAAAQFRRAVTAAASWASACWRSTATCRACCSSGPLIAEHRLPDHGDALLRRSASCSP